jgi:hypothetical protein
MKRVLKNRTILAIAVMLLMANGTYAQILTDYQNVSETSYQTAGLTFRLYVEPDSVYSPGYVGATNSPINANARWTWTYPAGLVTGVPVSGVVSASNTNYVEFTNPTVGGPYTVDVVESNTTVGCADATAISQVVQIIAAPQATITTADPAPACGGQPAMTVNMTFTEAVPSTLAAYAFAVNELIENIDPSDALIGAALVDNDGFKDFPTTGKLKTPALTGAGSPYGYSFTTAALTVRNNLRTRYTYTLIKASDAPVAAVDGVISAISQKSDYIAGTVSTYAFTDNQIVIVINPAPTTGPIYHIPNNFAY